MNYSIFKPERVINGVTLVELAVIMIILVIIAGAAIPRITSLFEDADAQMLRSIAAETELSISAGLSRGKTHHQLTTNGMGFMDDILGFIEESHGGTIKAEYLSAATFAVSVVSKGVSRKASYIVADNGKVMITDASGFNHYTAYAGDLVKDNVEHSSNTDIASALTTASSLLAKVSQGSDSSAVSLSSVIPIASALTGNPGSSSTSTGNSGVDYSIASANNSSSSSTSTSSNNNGRGNAYGKSNGNNGRGNAYAYGRPVASPF